MCRQGQEPQWNAVAEAISKYTLGDVLIVMDCCHAGDIVRSKVGGGGDERILNIEDAVADTARNDKPVIEIIAACHWNTTSDAYRELTFTMRLAGQNCSNMNTMAIHTELAAIYRAKESDKRQFHYSMRGSRYVSLATSLQEGIQLCLSPCTSMTQIDFSVNST